jgi:hypothetical protein
MGVGRYVSTAVLGSTMQFTASVTVVAVPGTGALRGNQVQITMSSNMNDSLRTLGRVFEAAQQTANGSVDLHDIKTAVSAFSQEHDEVMMATGITQDQLSKWIRDNPLRTSGR